MNIKYDVLGFPIFNGINIKFELKLDKKLLVESDKMQISECVKQLKEAINSGVIEKKIFNEKQLQQINSGEYRRWIEMASSSGIWKNAISISKCT